MFRVYTILYTLSGDLSSPPFTSIIKLGQSWGEIYEAREVNMPEITKKITRLLKAVDKLLDEGAKVVAIAKEIKDSSKPKDDQK